MESWWELGEGTGVSGRELHVGSITCPHCLYKGSFEEAFNAQTVNQSLHKTMYFVVLRCRECLMFCSVMWSPSRAGGLHGMHAYVVFPRSLKEEPKAPDHWPEQVGRAWEQAHKAIQSASWDAAATIAGRALQAATRNLNATPGKLAAEIEELGAKGILPKSMVEWAHEIRILRNVGAHPDPVETAVEKEDAMDIVKFLDYFLVYFYNLPKEIKDYKERRQQND